jgi:class 3 adenylate cyclase
MGVLREYHAEMGKLILAHEGTLERFTGDGMMIFFNDPLPVPDAGQRAARMAAEMQDRVSPLTAKWRRLGYELGLGIGIAKGFATIGGIGFEGRWDYGAIGTVTNLAARLCGEAKGGEILVSTRLAAELEEIAETEEMEPLTLKGFARPVPAMKLRRLKLA